MRRGWPRSASIDYAVRFVMRLTLITLALTLGACRCGEPIQRRTAADWVGAPNPLVLPGAYVGQQVEAEVTIDNLGGVTETAPVAIDAPFTVSADTLTLGSGESARLRVFVIPTTAGFATAQLHIGILNIPVSVEALAVPQCNATVCTDAQFDPQLATCVSTDKQDGTACDDGCVTGTCRSGICEGQALGCDDSDRCTTDGCGANGCIHVPTQCPSGGPCRAPACDAMTGCTTVEAPDGTLCGADDCRANQVDVCIAGQCVTRPRPNEGRCANTWVPGTLSGRSHHAMAWDETRARVVLFGGYTSWGHTPETWEWNGTLWEVRTPTQSPPAVYRPVMTYDLSRSRTVLFAGKADDTSELWEWDGITWVQRVSAMNGPATHGDPNHLSAGIAYDPARRVTIIVVFKLGRSQPIETWEWNGTTLRQRAPLTVPEIYYGAGTLAWDGTRQRVTLLATRSDPMVAIHYNAVWEWDGNDWTDRSAPAQSIDGWGTFQAAPAWDADRRQLVMKASEETITYDGQQWRVTTDTGPQPIGSQSPIVFDTARHQLVLFDGSITWTWDGTQWSRLTQPNSPRLVALVTDTVRNRVLGFELDQPPNVTTWEWDRREWKQLTASNPPSGRQFSVAFDSQRDRVVLFGANETWEFDGATSTWSKRAPAHQPQLREEASMAYDPIRQRVLLFGGRVPLGVTLGDAWEWDGTDWTQLSNVGAPSARAYAPMIWNSTEARLLLLSPPMGTTDIEAWSWTGTWANVTPPTMMPAVAPRFIRTMAEDPVRQTIVGVEGVSFNNLATWEFSSTGWTQRMPTVKPGTTSFPLQGAAWDPVAQQVVLSGVGQTWLFLP